MASDFRAGVEIWPFRACVIHQAIIIGTVRSLWLWDRYHVPQNVSLFSIVIHKFLSISIKYPLLNCLNKL